MTGAAIAIDDASAADTILRVKQRVFALNRKLPVRRQRLMYRPGPHGIDPLADDETLGGAGVAQDGTAELDVLLADLTAAEVNELNEMVRHCRLQTILFGQLRLALIPLAIFDNICFTYLRHHLCASLFPIASS
jgi:hypothetical protein